jgi:hypothetical protein
MGVVRRFEEARNPPAITIELKYTHDIDRLSESLPELYRIPSELGGTSHFFIDLFKRISA